MLKTLLSEQTSFFISATGMIKYTHFVKCISAKFSYFAIEKPQLNRSAIAQASNTKQANIYSASVWIDKIE
jgi:hypothetical protein